MNDRTARSQIGLGSTTSILLMVLTVLACSCGGWKSPSPICMAGAQFDDRGRCQAQSGESHNIPFREGFEARVTQGFHGYATHRKDLAFAIDFACDEGTPITASRSGVVWSVRKDSNKGCNDEACVADANYVIVDHGDGTYSSYYHLQHKGVIVEPGEQVCQGQVLGLCGDTGYASGTHLHFSIMDTRWTTLPVSFEEAKSTSMGVVLPRQTYESQNRRQSRCKDTEYSRLGRDAFIHRGILLRKPMRTVITDDEQRTMLIEGNYLGDQPQIGVRRREVGTDDWIDQCAPVDENGAFSLQIDWPKSVFDGGHYFFMLTGSDENCSAPGWAWSYRFRILSSEDSAVEQPRESVQGRDSPVRPR